MEGGTSIGAVQVLETRSRTARVLAFAGPCRTPPAVAWPAQTPAGAGRLTVKDATQALPILRLGSLTARLDAAPALGADIAWIFGTSLKVPTIDLVERVTVEIMVGDEDQVDTSAPVVPPDGMVVRQGRPVSAIHTEVLSVAIDYARTPTQVRITVRRGERSHYELRVHLAVVFHKILFLMDRVVLHAAAVELHGRLALFIGDRGAGKTTTAMALSRAGGTVLGEDHLVLHRTAGEFLVSGCDERWRIDERTERYFFGEPLPLEASDYAGRMKKEVTVRSSGASEPFLDRRPEMLFFIRAGDRFDIRRIPRGITVLRLMEEAGKLQRFVDADDRQRFLNLLSDFVQTITPYALERTDNLADLDRVVDFLHDAVRA